MKALDGVAEGLLHGGDGFGERVTAGDQTLSANFAKTAG